MKHADWVGVLHLVANKHDLVLSDALINFADDVLAQANKQAGFIVSNGDLSKGFYFHGAFKTYEEAFKYGKENFDYSGFIVHELHK